MASKRGYCTQADLAEFADISINNATEADDQISQAEEMIDGYVGAQNKFYPHNLKGLASGGSTTTVLLDTQYKDNYPYTDFFKGCHVEIIGGTNTGAVRRITGSTSNGSLTVDTAFSSAIDATSFYKIYQVGKFPRYEDSTMYTLTTPTTYYKSIPEAVKRAVAAQVAYMIEMGEKFLNSDGSSLLSEGIGDYSYSRNPNNGSELIAPRAKLLLKGITNRKGVMII